MNLLKYLRALLAASLLLLPIYASAVNLVQAPKFGTVKTVTTSQTLTVTPTSAPTTGNTLVVGFSASSAGGVLSFTSLQDNHGNNFAVLTVPLGTSGFTGLTGNAILSNIPSGTTSVTLVFANTTSVNVAIDLIVYEVAGTQSADVTNANSTTGNSTSFSFSYTTTAANEFAWCSAGSNSSSSVVTPTNGWTIDDQPSIGNTGAFFSHLDGAATGATAFTGTVAPTTAWQSNIATVQAGGAPKPPRMMLMGVSKLIHHKPAANDSTFTHKRAA